MDLPLSGKVRNKIIKVMAQDDAMMYIDDNDVDGLAEYLESVNNPGYQPWYQMSDEELLTEWEDGYAGKDREAEVKEEGEG